MKNYKLNYVETTNGVPLFVNPLLSKIEVV